ncbi:MAG: signal recognition particle-docking protein FtsY [Nitrospirae bacterium]|nr:MAG: signal recognition particle-docking protein FtsY [Nitrospirota bacterium]
MAWFDRLKQGLHKTRQSVQESLRRLMGGAPDAQTLEELEAALLGADVGVAVTQRLLHHVKTQGTRGGDSLALLKEALGEILIPAQSAPLEHLIAQGPQPFVILTVGVNGVGKTTTIAKLASRFKKQGLSPLLVAADTFRAAAIEQLEVWGKHIGVDVIKHRQGADPSAVAFDGVTAAKARKSGVVLIDTAGRLHTKHNLMDELKKMKRVIARELPEAPHEVLLILDGTIGQNALVQARQFHEAIGVTGLAITKLDGTAKGGILVAIASTLAIPVRLVGVGEQEDDLQDFQAQAFVDALLAVEEE